MTRILDLEAIKKGNLQADSFKTEIANFYTYKNGRKCRHCGAPLADQLNKRREFCPREVLPDGTVKNCKDDYWSQIGELEKTPFQNMLHYHRSCSETLEHLYQLNLPQITLETLEQVGIDLCRCAKHEFVDGEDRFYYIGYCLTVKPDFSIINLTIHHENIF